MTLQHCRLTAHKRLQANCTKGWAACHCMCAHCAEPRWTKSPHNQSTPALTMCLQMDAHEAVKPWQVAKPCTPGCETSASGGESRENLAPQVAKKTSGFVQPWTSTTQTTKPSSPNCKTNVCFEFASPCTVMNVSHDRLTTAVTTPEWYNSRWQNSAPQFATSAVLAMKLQDK